jgi:mycofactocin system glycosyltransferase
VRRERPLALVELQDPAAQLLERMQEGETVRADAPMLRVLRRLDEIGLVELSPVAEEWPSVTVVVPVRDRPRALARAIASLRAQDYPPERLEVVVVDDGSSFAAEAPEGVRVVHVRPSRGPAGARNAGASAARGQVLAFVDSDCEAEPGWLRELATELADPAVAAAGGRVLGARQRTWLERYEAVRSPLDLGPHRAVVRPQGVVPYLVGANLALRRSAFWAVGGFDSSLRVGEDVDLSWRLAAAGYRLVYRPRAVVRHHHRSRLAGFLSSRLRYAGSEAELLRRHPANGRWLGLSPGLAGALVGPAGLVAFASEQVAAAGRLAEATGLPWGRSLEALLRGQAASSYHLARQLARYWALPLVALPGPKRRRLLALALVLTVPGMADWARLRPRLSLPAFLVAHALDELAYHSGILVGCALQRTLRPLQVELRLLGRG